MGLKIQLMQYEENDSVSLESSSGKIQAKMILKGTGSSPPPPTFPQLRSPLLRSPLSITEGVKKGDQSPSFLSRLSISDESRSSSER